MSRNRTSVESFSNSRRVLAYAPLAFAIMLSFARPTQAANIAVNSADAISEPGVCTLIDAVTALNTQAVVNGCAAGDGMNDTIDLTGFTTPTTISLTTPTATGHALIFSASATINGPLNGQTPLVTIQRSTVSGTPSFGLIDTTAALTLNGLTLSNGASGTYAGGAILAGDSLSVSYCVIQNNSSGGAGGGIAASSGQLSIAHSTITGNTAQNAGGGIESNVGMRIYYSTVTNNATLSGTAPINGGGGISSNALVHARNTLFDGNTSASAGGALYLSGGGTIDNSTISNNTASGGSGGGISGATTAISVNTSTINSNHASGDGGGIGSGGVVNLTNSTITGNNAGGVGGGVSADTLASTYSTIASNTSTGAGGGVNFASGADGQATIISGNMPDDLATASATTMTGEYNIVGVTTAATAPTIISCAAGVMLGDLANNGGPTQTMALLPGSCAIDAASGNPAVSTDQRGFARPAIMSTNADIGAFESGATDPDVIFQNGFES